MSERKGETIFEKYSDGFLEILARQELLKEHLSRRWPGAYIRTPFPGALSLEWSVCGVGENP